MSLQLAPEVEQRVREQADAEGVSVSDLVARYFPPMPATPPRPEIPDEETEIERVQALLTKWQAETGDAALMNREHRTLAELSAQWAAEDALLTDEQREADHRLQEEYERGDFPSRVWI